MNSKVVGDFIGHFVWGVKRGHGSFFVMNIGSPRLNIREPIELHAGKNKKIIENFKRRKIVISGDYLVWIQNCKWCISCCRKKLASSESAAVEIEHACKILDGQKLLDITYQSNGTSIFKFDLGAQIEADPSIESEEDQWSIYKLDDVIVSFDQKGNITYT